MRKEGKKEGKLERRKGKNGNYGELCENFGKERNILDKRETGKKNGKRKQGKKKRKMGK